MTSKINLLICKECSGPLEFYPPYDMSYSKKKCRVCGNVIVVKPPEEKKPTPKRN